LTAVSSNYKPPDGTALNSKKIGIYFKKKTALFNDINAKYFLIKIA